jgi:23S rRNA (uracil1939-C5)-methyltransferase
MTEHKSIYPDSSLTIESMDIEAQGIAHRADGKVVFVDGALPYEVVRANVNRKKDNWEKASLSEIYRESFLRVTPKCSNAGLHTGSCGGCKMQHLDSSAQVAIKQRVLEDLLSHLGQVKPQVMMRPIHGPQWGYRFRARLSVRDVKKKNSVLVGFHERKSRYVADMQHCEILPTHMSNLLLPLRDLISSLDAREHCPQIELAVGDEVNALVLRHMVPLNEPDKIRLLEFGQHHKVQWWLQPSSVESTHLMPADPAVYPQQGLQLSYKLPDFEITMPFKPTDFTQVNPHINQVLVSKALGLLEPQKSETVIDWFCGLGNFTLPLACRSAKVIGIEGSQTLLDRAQSNHTLNAKQAHRVLSLCEAHFACQNLFEITSEDLLQLGQAQKWLIDPPREGAFALVKALSELVTPKHDQLQANAKHHPGVASNTKFLAPKKIVYVSCNPATLARDAKVLVHEAGYTLTHAGIVNMFPHTAHVESIAVFERQALTPGENDLDGASTRALG